MEAVQKTVRFSHVVLSDFHMLFQAGSSGDGSCTENCQIFTCCSRQEIEEVEDVHIQRDAVAGRKLRRQKPHTQKKMLRFSHVVPGRKLRGWRRYRTFSDFQRMLRFHMLFQTGIEEMKDVQKCSGFCMLF